MTYFNYFSEIEDTFIRRRGRHLLLSPKDWALIESWQQMGVPLHVALRGIEESFDSFEAQPRRRTVKSLIYCQEEVEAQFAEWLANQHGAAPSENVSESLPEHDKAEAQRILAHLTRTCDALRTSLQHNHVPDMREALQRTLHALTILHRDFEQSRQPDFAGVEKSLEDWEQHINAALRQSLPPVEVKAARKAAETQLKSYRAKLEAAKYQQTLDNLLLKSLREQHAIPRLSLFYL